MWKTSDKNNFLALPVLKRGRSTGVTYGVANEIAATTFFSWIVNTINARGRRKYRRRKLPETKFVNSSQTEYQFRNEE
jgi:hypothetical protein